MQHTTKLQNIIQDFLPLKELSSIVDEYIKEDIMLLEIKTLVDNDFCHVDCQSNYDPPLPLCKGCNNIINKIKELNSFRLSIGLTPYKETELW